MNRIEDAMRHASRWLRSAQSPSGAWNDFWTPSGASDEWVTAYIGAALASSPEEPARDAAQAAWGYLIDRQHADGGWGYSARVPSDADSTAWTLIFAERIGQQTLPCLDEARRFLERARVGGGIATYADVAPIRDYVEADPAADFSGWAQPHACVTGVASQVASLDSLLDAVLGAQQADGSWRGYWWFEDAYATAMSVIALSGRPPTQAESIERACGWARRRLDDESEPSAFTLSLLLAILTCGADATPHLERCALALIASQKPGGAWRGSAQLRIPRPDAIDPASNGDWHRWFGSDYPFQIFSLDQCNTFTTATAFAALHTLSRSPSRDPDIR